jgi:hypothetical protein
VNDLEIGQFPIEVRVLQGVAYLTGPIRLPSHADRATALAQAVPGVTAVRPALNVVGTVPVGPGPSPPPPPPGGALLEPDEPRGRPGLLAVGATIGWSAPRAAEFRTRMSISPLFKLGAPQGLGLAIGFDWFQADFLADDAAPIARIHVRPIMAGLGYTLVESRLSIAPSIVAGYAFNSLSITDTGSARGLPVEVHNSLALRAGVSTWFDLTERTAVNAAVGYLVTGLRLTVLENGQLVARDASGNTALVHVGVAYRLF